MKKLSTFVKIALAVQVGGIIYGITNESGKVSKKEINQSKRTKNKVKRKNTKFSGVIN